MCLNFYGGLISGLALSNIKRSTSTFDVKTPKAEEIKEPVLNKSQFFKKQLSSRESFSKSICPCDERELTIAEISERMKNILFWSISHELRSPVNHINGILGKNALDFTYFYMPE